MKWIIASDVHGYPERCRKIAELTEKEGAERLILLGDLFHGPKYPWLGYLEKRLPVPRKDDHFFEAVCEALTPVMDRITAVRGNWDTDEDMERSPFPIAEKKSELPLGSRTVLLFHGEECHEENLPPVRKGDVVLVGHTHIPKCRILKDCFLFNPGSVSLPKEGTYSGYILMEDGVFFWRDLDGNTVMRCDVNA